MPPGGLTGRDYAAGITNSGYFGNFIPPDIGGFVTTNAQANGSPVPPSNPFPPINVSNYYGTPGDGGGLTSTDSNGGSGLNIFLILGLLAAAAFAVFMLVR